MRIFYIVYFYTHGLRAHAHTKGPARIHSQSPSRVMSQAAATTFDLLSGRRQRKTTSSPQQHSEKEQMNLQIPAEDL